MTTKKDARGRTRDYKAEYKAYHGKPAEIAKRSSRNQARSTLGLKRGDSREADHIKPLERGGTNARGNLRATSRRFNRTRPNPG